MSCSWGRELWDQREAIEKHTQQGIDFLDKCASFVKERVKIEQEYAKSLRKLCKQYQFKKKEEEELIYTYLHAFKNIVQEVDDYSGQRERIAESVTESVLKQMHQLSSQSKHDRRKHISELNDLKQALEATHKLTQNAKKDYEKASQEAEIALKAYEQASNSMDLTKAQILKFQNASKEKGHNSDKAKDDYVAALENFNKTQTLYYDVEMPKIIDDKMQSSEENRITKLCEFFSTFAESHQNVAPIVEKCLEGMVTAARSCDPPKDSQTLVENFKTGNHRPADVVMEIYGRPDQTLRPNVSPKQVRSTKRGGLFKSKEKSRITSDGFADDFSELPPEQRKRKFNKEIKKLEDHISQLSKSREGMVKLGDTCQQFGGDLQTIQGQIEDNAKEIDKANTLLYQYQCWLAAIENTENPQPPAKLSGSTSSQSISSVASMGGDANHAPMSPQASPQVVPPPPQVQEESPSTTPSPDVHDEFDELKCHTLYDFLGNSDGELTCSAGEELVIVEDDDGSGWTLVARGTEEGYVPTSYVQKI